jgi:hypothetical protein
VRLATRFDGAAERFRRLVAAAAAASLAAGAVALAAAPGARADTFTVGEFQLTMTTAEPSGFGQGIPVFQGASSTGSVLTAPELGTLDSWSFLSAGVATGSNFALAVLAPQDGTGTSWKLVAQTAAQTVTSASGTDAVMGPFTISPGIQVGVGDVIALVATDGSDVPVESGSIGTDGVRYFNAPFAGVGSVGSIDPSSTADNGQVVPVQATVDYIPNTSPPAITGTPEVGQTLSCDPGDWGQTPDAYAYQWLRDGAAIVGATGATYAPVIADEAHALSCQVTASIGTTAAGRATSAATDPVKPGPPAVPIDTQLPSISGTTRQFMTLTADPGLWQNGVTRFSYVWLRCSDLAGTQCAPVTGATTSTYLLGRDDIGSTIRVIVTASNGVGSSAPAESTPTAVIQRGVIAAQLTVTPQVSCTGVRTVIDARGSVSPDGIKSYRIDIVDLTGAGVDEDEVTESTFANAFALLGGVLPAYEIDLRTTAVYDESVVTLTFGWDRIDYDDPGVLVRDPVGIYLAVSDYAGKTASATAVIVFNQQYSSQSRAGCPASAIPIRNVTPASLSSLVVKLSGSGSGAHASAGVSCAGTLSCTAGVTVAARSLAVCRACARPARKRAKQGIVLARGVSAIPAGQTRRVRLALTRQGRKALGRLRHGGAVRVTVTVTSVGATGRTVVRRKAALLL